MELVREVSWSNVRDKLNVGLFDAAHLLAPVAIASSLGLGHIKVPMVAPFNLAMNGNAITVSLPLHAQLRDVADGDLADPSTSARALAEIVRLRGRSGAEPLTFGMTFPFSTHNYQLRYWMAAGRNRSRRRCEAGGAAASLHDAEVSPMGRSTAFASGRRGTRSP